MKTTKIDDSFRNKCIVHDLKTVTGASLSSVEDCSFTEDLSNRVEVNSLGDITEIDGKRVHKFPWCSFFILESSPDFEKYKNGLTEELMISYHGESSWKAMEASDPGCCKQSLQEKQEVFDYWKNSSGYNGA
jgi:hypothetical protein